MEGITNTQDSSKTAAIIFITDFMACLHNTEIGSTENVHPSLGIPHRDPQHPQKILRNIRNLRHPRESSSNLPKGNLLYIYVYIKNPSFFFSLSPTRINVRIFVAPRPRKIRETLKLTLCRLTAAQALQHPWIQTIHHLRPSFPHFVPKQGGSVSRCSSSASNSTHH